MIQGIGKGGYLGNIGQMLTLKSDTCLKIR